MTVLRPVDGDTVELSEEAPWLGIRGTIVRDHVGGKGVARAGQQTGGSDSEGTRAAAGSQIDHIVLTQRRGGIVGSFGQHDTTRQNGLATVGEHCAAQSGRGGGEV